MTMFRATIGASINTLKQLTCTEWVGINSTFPQIIRWKKKPMWLPPAKSKLFRISQRYRPPPEEYIEIQRLYNNYRTYRKSIKQYFIRVAEENKVQFDEEVVRKAEEDDFNRCSEINEKWNKEVEKVRVQRVAAEKARRQMIALKKLEAAEIESRELKDKIEEKIKQAKKESVTFITAENIDQAIEEALANVVNYNAAIDTDGNTYEGHYDAELKQVHRTLQQST